jgi:hypothetical protein
MLPKSNLGKALDIHYVFSSLAMLSVCKQFRSIAGTNTASVSVLHHSRTVSPGTPLSVLGTY